MLEVVLVYSPRRADCPTCGPHAEQVPWAEGKSPLTKSYAWFLARWAKRLPWNRVAGIFGCGWHQVWEAVRQAVDWGVEHRDLSGVTALGVDDVCFGAKAKFQTLVYQLCSTKTRLLFVAEGRKEKALSGILKEQGDDGCANVTHVCSDMWRAYLKSVAKPLPNATHILDRFHIEAKFNEAVDKVRRAEARELAGKGLAVLKNLRYAFLKRPENLTDGGSATGCRRSSTSAASRPSGPITGKSRSACSGNTSAPTRPPSSFDAGAAARTGADSGRSKPSSRRCGGMRS